MVLKMIPNETSQLMRLRYLSHRRTVTARASLHIRAVSPEPSLFAHIKYGSRRRVRPQIRYLVPLDGCACVVENEFTEGDKCHNLMSRLKLPFLHLFAENNESKSKPIICQNVVSLKLFQLFYCFHMRYYVDKCTQ